MNKQKDNSFFPDNEKCNEENKINKFLDKLDHLRFSKELAESKNHLLDKHTFYKYINMILFFSIPFILNLLIKLFDITYK